MINEDKRLKVVYQLSWACFVNDPWLTRSRGKLPRDQQLQMLHYDSVKLVVTRIAGSPPSMNYQLKGISSLDIDIIVKTPRISSIKYSYDSFCLLPLVFIRLSDNMIVMKVFGIICSNLT